MSLSVFLISWLIVIATSISLFGYRKKYTAQRIIMVPNKGLVVMDTLIVIIVLAAVSYLVYHIFQGSLIVCFVTLIANFLLIGLAIEVGMLNTIKTIGLIAGAVVAMFPYGNKILEKMTKGIYQVNELFDTTESMINSKTLEETKTVNSDKTQEELESSESIVE